MKTIITTSLFLITAFGAYAMGSRSPAVPPVAVQNFELTRYLGTWYEIGSIPQSFQKGCVCTRATYSLRADSKVDVLNECRLTSPTGKLRKAKGLAQFRGAPDQGDLWVSFFLWFKGSYRIIALDQQNYEWSLVSNDKATTLWILSREPEMSDSQITLLLNEAKRQGVDVSKFEMQKQNGCHY